MSPSTNSSATHAVSYLRKSAKMLKVLKIAGTVLGAGLIAVSRWVDGQTFEQANVLATLMLLIGIVLATVGSLVIPPESKGLRK